MEQINALAYCFTVIASCTDIPRTPQEKKKKKETAGKQFPEFPPHRECKWDGILCNQYLLPILYIRISVGL